MLSLSANGVYVAVVLSAVSGTYSRTFAPVALLRLIDGHMAGDGGPMVTLTGLR